MPQRRRRIGPLPINGGLHLDPPTSRPSGLLDVLNVESRRGSLMTRRGLKTRGIADHNQPAGEPGHAYPTSWSGIGSGDDEYGYIYFRPSPDERLNYFPPGAFFFIEVTADATETDEYGSLTWEYYDSDGEWSRLDVDMFSLEDAGELTFPGASSDCTLVIRRPADIADEADPLGLGFTYDGWWIRVSRAEGEWKTASPIGTQRIFHSTLQHTGDLCSFDSRGGWRTVLFASDSYLDGAIHLYDVDRPTDAGYLDAVATLEDDSVDPSEAPRAKCLYVASTDTLLIFFDRKWYEFDPAANTVAAFAIESGDDAPPHYQDIPLRDAFPDCAAMAIYDERVFIAEAGTNIIRYTAPSEFWRTLPSSNIYRLGHKGGGAVQAMVPLGGALYILTDTAIYQAVSGGPVAGQDAQVYFTLIDDVGCAAPRSVAAADGRIYFLSEDGPRMFDGSKAERLARGVRDLFRPDSEHPLALRNPEGAVGIWHPVEEQYRLFYRSSAAYENDTCLVVQMPSRRCWLWGSELRTGLDASEKGQRRTGIRASAATFRPDQKRMLIADKHGIVYEMDQGERDGPSEIEWRAETHHVNLGRAGWQRMINAEVTCNRKNAGTMNITGVADGRIRDTRAVSVQRDGQSAGAYLGAADAAGEAMSEDVDAYAPAVWRGSLVGRNHRVKIASSESGGHRPQEIAGISIEIDEL